MLKRETRGRPPGGREEVKVSLGAVDRTNHSNFHRGERELTSGRGSLDTLSKHRGFASALLGQVERGAAGDDGSGRLRGKGRMGDACSFSIWLVARCTIICK